MNNGDPAPLLLDTHYWIWLRTGAEDRFTKRMLRSIRQSAAEGRLLVSVISVWEVGMLAAKGRIRLKAPCEQWVREALTTPGLSLVPLTLEIALEASALPGPFHGDPSDRIIVATARKMGARLLTRDQKLLDYAGQHHLAVV